MTMNNAKILIADDNNDILELLTYNFTKEGFSVRTASNGEECIKIAFDFCPDIIILDIMMPKMDGVETCRRLRSNPLFKNTFIVFLTARIEEYSELAGFDVGADDYITKPIKPRIILSRVQALLRRGNITDLAKDKKKLSFEDLEILGEEYLVKKGENFIHLPKKEFELLYMIASNPNRIFRRDEILDTVWGEVNVVDRTVDVHIRRLREKIGEDFIHTVKGVGYKFTGRANR